MPTDSLKVCHDFHLQNPYYYYASNSETIDVDNWVMTEGLQHMALAPKFKSYTPTPMLMTPNLGYLNGRLLQQMDMLYRIPNPAPHDAGFSIPVQTKSWVHDRFMYNIQYKTWGSYVEEIQGGTETETTPITTIIESIESSISKADAEAQEAASHYKPIGNESIEAVAKISEFPNDTEPHKSESHHEEKRSEHHHPKKHNKKKDDEDGDEEAEKID